MAAATREMELHRLLRSPHLAPLIDMGVSPANNNSSSSSREVLALFPYYAGGSLQARCDALRAAGGHFSEGALLAIFAGVCRGVHALHTARPPLAHRDVKPANIMLAAGDLPVLIDLGSADAAAVPLPSRHAVAAVQERAAQFSSMPFRAPELFDASLELEITAATDIWVRCACARACACVHA